MSLNRSPSVHRVDHQSPEEGGHVEDSQSGACARLGTYVMAQLANNLSYVRVDDGLTFEGLISGMHCNTVVEHSLMVSN